MSSSGDFGVHLSFNEMSAIAEAQIADLNSQVSLQIINEAAKLFITQLKLRADNDKKIGKKKNRIYVPFDLEGQHKFELQKVYRDFEIVAATQERTATGYARAAAMCVAEAMLSYAPHRENNILAYGTHLRTIVMRNRGWIHLCQSAHDPYVYTDAYREDQALSNIYVSLVKSNKHVPLLLREYMEAVRRPACMQAHLCRHKANVATLVLDKVDTNFRQLCAYMVQHDTRLLFFAIPGHKNIEEKVDGPFPEIGGYIAHRDGVAHIIFDGDISYQMAYTHTNYIELMARTRVLHGGFTFVKEFVGRRGAHVIYKVTRSEGLHTDYVAPYKSWLDPAYRDYYVMTVPVLPRFGNLNTTKHWETKNVWIRKSVIDTVLEVLMSVDGKEKLSEVASVRLFSVAYNIITGGQLTRQENPLTVQQSQLALMVLFTRAFMLKFETGSVVKTIAPMARGVVRLSEASLLSLITTRLTAAGNSAISAVTSGVISAMREYNYSIESRKDIDLPSYTQCIGYREYAQSDSVSGDAYEWIPKGFGPAHGHDPHLPGGEYGMDTVLRDLKFESLTEDDIQPAKHTVLSRMAGVTTFVRNQFTEVTSYDPEDVDGVLGHSCDVDKVLPKQIPEARLHFVKDDLRRKPVAEIRSRPLKDDMSMTAEADILVQKVLDLNPVEDTVIDVVYNSYLAPPVKIDVSDGSASRTPLKDIQEALLLLFPRSQLLDPTNVESMRLYNDVQIVAKTLSMKVDLSKLEALKPESMFKSVLRGHVLPNIKDNTVNTLQTIAKRNADTPYHMTPAGVQEKWEMVWKSMCSVYFVPNTNEFLDKQPRITPNERNLREWLHKQPGTKINNLLNCETFDIPGLKMVTKNLNLMLKGKLKPVMDSSYGSVNLPQSVQYDKTGASVALLSPAFRDVVKREFYCYKPNVLVMQRKSPADLVKFLNQFDHRPDDRGRRSYIEIDESLFDKSQVYEIARMYLLYLEKVGLLGDYVELVSEMFDRSVSSVKAGVKILLKDQNVSGAAFTLHRNNSVSMIILAIFLKRIENQIEFVMLMGDDVTVAIRGKHPNIASWENELTMLFNMSSKITIHEHGYFCSTDIIHRPDGTTTIMRDVVKSMLSLMGQNHKEEELFEEMYISFCDSLMYITDLASQEYSINALPLRWKKVLPTASPEAFRLLISGLAGVKTGGFKTYRQFFSDEKYVRHY